MKHAKVSLALWLAASLAPTAFAQAPGRRGGDAPKPADTLEVPTEAGIAWFGTWEAGLAEAQRTGRPILLMSAAPQCSGVPGMW